MADINARCEGVKRGTVALIDTVIQLATVHQHGTMFQYGSLARATLATLPAPLIVQCMHNLTTLFPVGLTLDGVKAMLLGPGVPDGFQASNTAVANDPNMPVIVQRVNALLKAASNLAGALPPNPLVEGLLGSLMAGMQQGATTPHPTFDLAALMPPPS